MHFSTILTAIGFSSYQNNMTNLRTLDLRRTDNTSQSKLFFCQRKMKYLSKCGCFENYHADVVGTLMKKVLFFLIIRLWMSEDSLKAIRSIGSPTQMFSHIFPN